MANETEKKKKRRSPAKWFKELFSELKKVTWPSFKEVVKQTGVVLVVTLFFLLVLMGMDALLGVLYDLLITGLTATNLTFFSFIPDIESIGALLSCVRVL